MKRGSVSYVQPRQGSHELRGIRRSTLSTRSSPTHSPKSSPSPKSKSSRLAESSPSSKSKSSRLSESTQQKSKPFVSVWSTPTLDEDLPAENDYNDDEPPRSAVEHKLELDGRSLPHIDERESSNDSVQEFDYDWLEQDELHSTSRSHVSSSNVVTKSSNEEKKNVGVGIEQPSPVRETIEDDRIRDFNDLTTNRSARPSLTRSGSIPQLAPTKQLVRRGSVDDDDTVKRQESNSLATHLWVSDANKRSSRLLDEWKRKEIWHDFKRAQENVVTQPEHGSVPSNPQGEDISELNESESVNPSFTERSIKSTSVRRLDDLLQNIRSEGSMPSRDVKQIRRATAFAHWSANGADGVPKKTGALEALMALSDQTTNRGSAPPTARNSADGTPLGVAGLVSKVDYDQLLQEKRRLVEEVAVSQQTLATEREALRSLNEKILNLENSERENRFLKEEIQRHSIQVLSSKDLIRAMEEQMSLTSKSEEQLKQQTRQLMQQNQALQAEILDKIASETVKVQKMAQLSAEKQNLVEEWQNKEIRSTQKAVEDKTAMQDRMIVQFTIAGKRKMLTKVFFAWVRRTNQMKGAKAQSIRVIISATKRTEIKRLAYAFARLRHHMEQLQHEQHLQHFQNTIDDTRQKNREHAYRAGLTATASIFQSYHTRLVTLSFLSWIRYVQGRKAMRQRLEYAGTKLISFARARQRGQKHAAFLTWKMISHCQGLCVDYEQAAKNEKELNEAKDCIFSLSRTKTRLEETMEKERETSLRLDDQLQACTSQLQLIKHSFVATVLRSTQQQWLRSILSEWRIQSQLSISEREFRLQIEMAEHRAEERATYAQSLDDYNKVLRNDLERFQHFSQDKRIAVDVLTKKLLREEEKLKRMEEQNVILEEKLLTTKSKLASIIDSHGAVLPISLLTLCKDVAVANLMDIFHQYATSSGMDEFKRISLEVVIELCQSLGSASDITAQVYRYAPDYAATRGLPFAEFVSTIGEVLHEVYGADDRRNERTKEFWMGLLSRMHGLRNSVPPPLPPITHIENGDARGRSPWGGQLTEEILQNQEKLLAVLEHETAAAERVVMEKTSKHPYMASHVPVSNEYQCDPVLPSESTSSSYFLTDKAFPYTNWMQTSQIQDLFFAFQAPLQRIMSQYTNGQPILVSNIIRMMEDLKLYPTFVSRELILHHTSRHCDRDGYFSPDALGVFLGNCAIELFATSPTAKTVPTLSAREIILSFFCDLGFLAESEMPGPSQLCLVGMEIENVLWSLFEYYSISDKPRDTSRVSMNFVRFKRFMEEIANSEVLAEQIFHGVLLETKRVSRSKDELHFDEFFIAIARLQQERNPSIRSSNVGDAVRQWMEQTQ